MTLCKAYGMSPFFMFEQDVLDVIMIINYFIEKGENKNTKKSNVSTSGVKRIKVNDHTATGGWF